MPLPPSVRTVALLSCVAACATPTDGPKKAAMDYLKALSARDGEAVWELLGPETQTRVASLHDTLAQTRALVMAHYPEPLQKEALAASGAQVVEQATDPRALFLRLFVGAGEPADEDGALARFSLQPRHTEVDAEGRTVVTTWGRDAVTVVEVGGAWRVVPDAADATRLDRLTAVAGRNLATVKQEIESVERRRFGAKPR